MSETVGVVTVCVELNVISVEDTVVTLRDSPLSAERGNVLKNSLILQKSEHGTNSVQRRVGL